MIICSNYCRCLHHFFVVPPMVVCCRHHCYYRHSLFVAVLVLYYARHHYPRCYCYRDQYDCHMILCSYYHCCLHHFEVVPLTLVDLYQYCTQYYRHCADVHDLIHELDRIHHDWSRTAQLIHDLIH